MSLKSWLEEIKKELLCSWDKSLNIGSCLLRILLFVWKTIWMVCCKWEATPSIYWSLGKSPLFFLWRFGLSDFVSVIIREQKGLRKRDYLEKCPSPLNKFPRNWFLHDMILCELHDALHVSNHWLHMVQMVKFKGVNFEENSQHATSNIQTLISTTQ